MHNIVLKKKNTPHIGSNIEQKENVKPNKHKKK